MATEDIEKNQEQLREKLEVLRLEHRDLDDIISRLSSNAAPHDQLQVQRLKKRKLVLKDMITRIEDRLIPDIIA
jgi:hypothetical protein